MTERTRQTRTTRQSKPRDGQDRQSKLRSHLARVAKEVEDHETFEVMPDVAYNIPSLFPSYNKAIQLGGVPLRCIHIVHGPTAEGKSTFCAGLVRSFQEQGHLTAWQDAEHSNLSKTWFRQLGVDPSLLLFEQPDYLEDAVDKLDQWITIYDELKEDDPDLAFIIILDSLSKFVPKKEFQRFVKEGSEAMDKGLARFRGLYLQTWFDHMTPIIGKRDIAVVAIGQERMVQDAKIWQPDYKVKGCQGAAFDASVRMRIKAGPKVKVGSDDKARIVGQKHWLYVFKNRVGYPNEIGAFYTSNGKGKIPIGFDLGREYVDVGLDLGVIQRAGAWYSYQNERIGQGQENVAYAIHSNDELRNAILKDIAKSISQHPKV